MRFMILRKADKDTEAGARPSAQLMAAMGKYLGELQKAGALLGAEGLRPSAQGSRVRLAAGKLIVTDGPFTGDKGLLAGFTSIEVKSREEALAWVERWPALDGDGQVELELRRLYEMSDFPVDPAEQAGGWREQEQSFRDATEAPGAPPAPPPRLPGTTRFLVMLRSDRTSESGAMPSEKVLAEMGALMNELAESGALLGGEGLKPSAQGARIKLGRGKHTITDGPFAETKELIAGYTLIQVRTKSEAIDFAQRWLKVHAEGLGVDESEIELRPLYEPEDFAA
jgi:hypothetical protein